MKTIDRYLAATFIKNLMVSLVAMVAFFFIQALLPDLTNQKYLVGQAIYYHSLTIPQITVQMAAVSVLLATVLTLSGLARTHELIACYSIGIGIRRIVGLIVSLVVVVSCLILVAQDRVLPGFYRARTNFYWREIRKHPDFFLDLQRDKVWYRSNNTIYNLQRFDLPSNTIHGMSIYTFDDHFNLVQVIQAEKAIYDHEKWRMQDGTVTLFSPDTPFPMIQSFKEKETTIAETPKDFQEIEKEADGLRLKELYHYIQRMHAAGADTKAYEVRFHSKLSLSLIPIVMCFLAVPFSLTGRREGSLPRDLGLCFATTFFYWVFYAVGLSLGSTGRLTPWMAAWLPSIVFMGLAIGLIARRKVWKV